MSAEPLPLGPFNCILADPPWLFQSLWGGRPGKAAAGNYPSRATDAHYATMELPDIKALPVGGVAAPDCALFMWIVDSMLPEALEVGATWGFKYKCVAFVWSKSRGEGVVPHAGLGYWSRKQAEICLLFTRGAPKRLSKGVEQIIHCSRGPHSAKPEHQYERIEALVGGPYLEIFARNTRPGWQSWGNQVGVRDMSLFSEPRIAAPPEPTLFDVIGDAVIATPEPMQEVPPTPMERTLASIKHVLDFHGVTFEQIKARTSSKAMWIARGDVYLALRERGLTYPQIGRIVGRHNTTVLTVVRHAKKRRDEFMGASAA